MPTETDFLVLGAGVTGLAAGWSLADHAIVLERESRPGGLVRTECIDGFWFDRVLHLLHLADPALECRIKDLLGDVLAPCAPDAWVETLAGTTRFPFQMHLAQLPRDEIVRCVRDLAEVTYRPRPGAPRHFEDYLLRTFGQRMCDLFMFPYNRKLWKRPLTELAPSGFTWNIAPADFEAVMRGALDADASYRPYNANGWYPRPPSGASQRGMEVLSQALAGNVSDLRYGHTVREIDARTRMVTVERGNGVERFRYREACLSTLPLPVAIRLCVDAPAALTRACESLTRNRVITVMLGVIGPRPTLGKWRYYSSPDVSFTRLVFLHEFDAENAPAEGWPLLAELTEPAERAVDDLDAVIARVQQDVARVGLLPHGSRIVVKECRLVDPAYVVMSLDTRDVVDHARRFLEERGIHPVGRYGRWEYSSMGQNMRDGFSWAEGMLRHGRGAGGESTESSVAGCIRAASE